MEPFSRPLTILLGQNRVPRQGGPAREMLKLSTYLGHTHPAHTYWYIQAVPELLERALKRVEEVES